MFFDPYLKNSLFVTGYIPLKKRRLREAMPDSSSENKEVNSIPGTQDSPKVTVDNSEGTASVGVPLISAGTGISEPEAKPHSVLSESFSEPLKEEGDAPSIESRDCDRTELCLTTGDSKPVGTDCTVETKSEIVGSEVEKSSLRESFPPKEGKNSSTLDSSNDITSNGKESTFNSNFFPHDSVESLDKSGFSSGPIQNMDSHLTPSVPGGNNLDSHGPAKLQGNLGSHDFIENLPGTEKSEAIRTSIDDKSDVNSNTTLRKSDTISCVENHINRSEHGMNDTEVGAVGSDFQVRASSILRDPRLSSSSSRSSRDSTDGHVFVRSDSVSSLEDTTSQKPSSDRKQSSEKFDGTPNAKKKV